MALVRLRPSAQTSAAGAIASAIVTGNYPSNWITDDLLKAAGEVGGGKFIIAIDTLKNPLTARADIVLPSCTWLEKAGTFQNARDMVQAFEQAIPAAGMSKNEAQIAIDLQATLAGAAAPLEDSQIIITSPDKLGQVPGGAHIATPVGALFNAADTRAQMAALGGTLAAMNDVAAPVPEVVQEPDMAMVEL